MSEARHRIAYELAGCLDVPVDAGDALFNVDTDSIYDIDSLMTRLRAAAGLGDAAPPSEVVAVVLADGVGREMLDSWADALQTLDARWRQHAHHS